jgi:hypothetical protein
MAKLPTLRKSSATPRKQVTGTSYESGQAVPIPPASFNELGSQKLSPIIDPVPDLSNRSQELRTYKKMIRGDVSVRSSLRAGKASILGAEFYVDAYSEDPQDQIIYEFVSDNIFNGGNLPWSKTLEGIVRFIENGFSVFEDVWELREWSPRVTSPTANTKKYTCLKKLAERPARTIGQFEYDDNGGLTGVHQIAINAQNQAKDILIPIEKCIIFTFEGDGNIEGESILRAAYRNWFYKDKLYTIDAIQKERHGIGVPEIEVLPGATKKDKDLAIELASNLRTNEKSYIVRPTTLTVGFAELKGNPVDALASAVHHDNQIMKNILVQFINMGIEGSGGGRATGATAFDMFMKAMRYIANMICDYINMFLIPKLVAYNFPTNRFPKLMVRNIGESKDFQMWSAGIRNLLESNGITPDMPTEQFLRKVADMPLKTEPRPEFADTAQTREQVLAQGTVKPSPNSDVNPPSGSATPAAPQAPVGKKSTSPNGGAGNIGKSPSSGAT